MYILGIESSCDETGAAVVSVTGGHREIKSNIVASQVSTHRLYGGVVPEIAGRAHIEAVSSITYEALKAAAVSVSDIGCVAVTSHPGLIGALLVGVNFAKSLAYSNGLPLVSVNHVHGHVAAGYLADDTLEPPFLALVVSGGHTSFYDVKSYTDYEEIGSTRDDAAGEAFDKIGRVIGMPYPAGAEMDRAAAQGNASGIILPSPALPGENLDFSFSGLKTAALNYINNEKMQGRTPAPCDMAAAVTGKIVSAIVRKTGDALTRTGYRRMVTAGGVAANTHLRRALAELCAARGVKLTIPPIPLCGDNAAMTAAEGYYLFRAGITAGNELNASAE